MRFVPIFALLCFSALTNADRLNVSLSVPKQMDMVRNAILKEMRDRNSKLVIMTDLHRDMDIKAFYDSIAGEASQTINKKVCLFLELEHGYQSALDGLKYKDPESYTCFENRHSSLQAKVARLIGRKPDHFLNLDHVAILKAAGVKIVAVDYPLPVEQIEKLKNMRDRTSAEGEELLVRPRNQYFADKIKAAFDRKECEVGFFSVGIGHVSPRQHRGHPRFPGVQELLPALKPVTIEGQTCGPTISCEPVGGTDFFLTFKK